MNLGRRHVQEMSGKTLFQISAPRMIARRAQFLRAVVLACPIALSAAAPSHAESSGCSAANAGSLDAHVPGSGTVTRQLALDTGDTLNITLRGSSGAKGSVALVSGAGAPQTLIGASSAGSASFTAPQTDTYILDFAADASGTASVSATCTSASVTAADAAFLARRKDLVNASDPDRIRINRERTPIADPKKPLGSSVAVDDKGNPTQVELSVSLSELLAAGSPGKKPAPGPVDLWVEGRMQNYAVDSTDSGNLGVLYFGTSSMIGPDIKTGALVQLDRGIETERYGGEHLAATGWMAGPYVSMNLGHGVIFDGRAAWGTTENISSGLGVETATGQTDRRLLRAKLTGTRQVEGWQVAPSVGFVYAEDAVRDALTNDMRAEGTGKVEVLPEVSRRFQLNGDTFVEPRAALGGYMGFDDLSQLNTSVSGAESELHLKAEAGVAFGVVEGTTLNATGGVESGTASTPDTWSGRLQLNMPLGN